jgi:hypothetical protein
LDLVIAAGVLSAELVAGEADDFEVRVRGLEFWQGGGMLDCGHEWAAARVW